MTPFEKKPGSPGFFLLLQNGPRRALYSRGFATTNNGEKKMTRTEKLARQVAAAGTKHWIEVGFGFLAVDAEVESAGEFEWMDGIFTVYVRFTGRIRKSGAVHPRGADATDKLFAVDTFELKG